MHSLKWFFDPIEKKGSTGSEVKLIRWLDGIRHVFGHQFADYDGITSWYVIVVQIP